MPAYPTSPGFNTSVKPLTRTRTRVSESGIPRQQDLSDVPTYEITVEHPIITTADMATLHSFYDTNQYADLTITAGDGRAYDAWYLTPYESRKVRNSGNFLTARTKLVATPQ